MSTLNDLPGRIDAIVTDATMLTADIKGLCLATADGSMVPPAEPGAHIDLWLPDGIVRQYSVLERVNDGTAYRIAVLREPDSRGGSAYVVDLLGKGQHVQLSGPRNHFALDECKEETVLIAGGIGITPILPMAIRLASAGKKFAFHYLGRARERTALLDVIEASALKDIANIHFSDEHGEADLRTLIGAPRPGVHVYVCGPGKLIDGVLAAASDWPAGSIHFERFAAPAATPLEAKHDGAPDAPFEVELARSDKVIIVMPDQSIMQALRQERVRIESVCCEGICGTCSVTLLAGEADHRDMIQTDAEKNQNTVIYVCVSRARSARLVLDL
jgi:ferredoxin-NADP reductase